MFDNDKSFLAVTMSLLIHGLLIALLDLKHLEEPVNRSKPPVEITLRESNNEHPKRFTKALEETPNIKRHDLERKADFLARLTQQFEQQMISPRRGVSRNASTQKTYSRMLDPRELNGQFASRTLKNNLSYTSDLESQFNFDLKKIQRGEITLLNADYSSFASFYDRISPMVRYAWLKSISQSLSDPVMLELMSLNKELWITNVEVYLDKNGKFINAIVVNPSGSANLDRAAIDAFKRSTPYINPPVGMQEPPDGIIMLNAQFALMLDPKYFVKSR